MYMLGNLRMGWYGIDQNTPWEKNYSQFTPLQNQCTVRDNCLLVCQICVLINSLLQYAQKVLSVVIKVQQEIIVRDKSLVPLEFFVYSSNVPVDSFVFNFIDVGQPVSSEIY